MVRFHRPRTEPDLRLTGNFSIPLSAHAVESGRTPMTIKRYDVELTRGSEDRLEEIHSDLIENRSADDPDALLDGFLVKIKALERYPRRGGVPKELAELGIREFRQVLLEPYRLIYRVAGSKVFHPADCRWPWHAGAAGATGARTVARSSLPFA